MKESEGPTLKMRMELSTSMESALLQAWAQVRTIEVTEMELHGIIYLRSREQITSMELQPA